MAGDYQGQSPTGGGDGLDSLLAGLRAVGRSATSGLMTYGGALARMGLENFAPDGDRTQTWQQSIDQERAQQQLDVQQHPYATTAGNVVGGVAQAVASGGGGILANVGKQAFSGAVGGYTANSGNGSAFGGTTAADTASGGVVGGTLGLLGGAATKALQYVAKKAAANAFTTAAMKDADHIDAVKQVLGPDATDAEMRAYTKTEVATPAIEGGAQVPTPYPSAGVLPTIGNSILNSGKNIIQQGNTLRSNLAPTTLGVLGAGYEGGKSFLNDDDWSNIALNAGKGYLEGTAANKVFNGQPGQPIVQTLAALHPTAVITGALTDAKQGITRTLSGMAGRALANSPNVAAAPATGTAAATPVVSMAATKQSEDNTVYDMPSDKDVVYDLPPAAPQAPAPQASAPQAPAADNTVYDLPTK